MEEYRLLPPGRQRRIAYSNYVNLRRHIRYSYIYFMREDKDWLLCKKLYENSKVYICDNEMECSICLNNINEKKDIIRLLNCNHGYHIDCIDKWFTNNNTCPICRNIIK